jgi:hypothetical protein
VLPDGRSASAAVGTTGSQGKFNTLAYIDASGVEAFSSEALRRPPPTTQGKMPGGGRSA